MTISSWKRPIVNIGILVLVLLGIYFYQFRFKPFLTEVKLYQYLQSTQNIQSDEVNISGSYKDTKVGQNQYYLFFTVKGSPYEYQYQYSFEENRWVDQRVDDGEYMIPTEEIIYTEERLEEIR